ncbi:MAG TPA: MlaD family protein [Bacteroidales bacterium]|nr:MlaD family protein [Bacteroidales bacterium]
MIKISDEIKVGAIALVTIVAFIWLYSFLKGQGLFSNTDKYHILYDDISGLEESSPVEVNGYKVGIVQDVKLLNDGSGKILVNISIEKGVILPEESTAEITTASLIAGMKIRLILGERDEYYINGDTIPGRLAVSIIDKVEYGFDPVIAKADSLLTNLNLFMISLNSILTPGFNENIKNTVDNLDSVSSGLADILMSREEEIQNFISDLSQFSSMLARNQGKLDTVISNFTAISDSLANHNISGTLTNLDNSIMETSRLLNNLNKGDGSAGKFMTDDSLYINLSNSLESLNILLTDLKENPGKYVHFSLFGGKQK